MKEHKNLKKDKALKNVAIAMIVTFIIAMIISAQINLDKFIDIIFNF